MLKIINGRIYDPTNGVSGEVRDLVIENGRIADSAVPDESCQIIDASGCAVLAGGVEIHSHVAGPKVNAARSMCPEDHYNHYRVKTDKTRSGTGNTVQSTYMCGYQYSRLGYTTVFEAAVPALEARHTHEELEETPLLDTGLFTLMGNNYMIMKILNEQDQVGQKERVRAVVSWLLTSSKGYAIKAVNPCGVENWKWNKAPVDLDTPAPPFGITPRQMMVALAEAAHSLKLPHGLHLHPNRLGEIGNVVSTLDTMKALEGYPVHFTHLQFYTYGMTKKGRLMSAAPKIAEYLNEHPKFTCDVGQIVFGPATTMTADSPMQYRLHQMTGHKWISSDLEMETGSGIVPMMYKPNILFNAIQWCAGLELLLLVKNPWQIILTTDHPNAGPFTSYPHIIRLLMDRDFRNSILDTLHPKTKGLTSLKDITREYTLEEIAIITRCAPAKALGLTRKGHLGVGADADVAIYQLQDDKEKMFDNPALVFKGGKMIVRAGEVIDSFRGKRLYVEPDAPNLLPADLVKVFKDSYSIALANFAVQDEYLTYPEVIACN